ncbi:two-component regulator propeller domain-containing protein [Ekhidna sp.]|uniref:ligand-binding sensor domain-containing protein n=1 Tax=Ekhidna sp. TaxID=2608089 RepID=UPI00329726A3
MVKIRLTIILLFASILALAGVRDFSIKQYGIDHDFDGIFIYSIVQDDDGYLWIGTDDGLYRFDGKTMINLNESDSTMGNLVTASTVSADGHLYLGYYEGGVSIVEHGRYRKVIGADTLASKINKFYRDSEGVIWVLSQNSGLARIFEDKAEVIPVDFLSELITTDLIRHENYLYIATSEGLVKMKIEPNGELSISGFVEGSFGKQITALYEDPHDDNVLWVGSEDGLYFVDHSDDEKLVAVRNLEHLRVTSIARDELKTLWIGTAQSGLIEIELKDNHPHKITSFDIAHGFPSNQINSLYVDRENEVWVGTFGSGLIQLNRAFFHHYELSKSVGIAGINDIHQVSRDLYYLASDKGLVRAFNKPGKDSLNFEIIQNTSMFSVNQLLVQEDVVWLGTSNKGLIKYNLNDGSTQRIYLNPVDPGASHMVRYITEGANNDLWVSIAGNGVYNIEYDGTLKRHFNTRNGFYHNEVFSILPDKAGNVWFGAQAVGLAILRSDGEIQFLTKDEIFPARDINSISQDDSGKIWIATSGEGLYSFNGEEFERFDESNGLVSNFCNAVEVDNANQIWVGHRMGLSLIQPEYGLVRQFDHPSELGETEAVINSVSKDAQGNIWFGNPYGVTKVILPHIQHVIKERETHIQNIRLFFQEVDLLAYSSLEKLDNTLPNDLDFHHSDNHITFDFIAINLKNPNAIHYQYQLKGYDKIWSPVTTSNVATFTNLDPGTYTFKVRESDHPGLWGDDYHEITFEIDHPYWEKWWFYLLQISFILGIMFITFMLSKRIQNLFLLRLMVYVSLFMLFEYIHTEVEPFIEQIAGETPIFQVGINLMLALILLPVELKLATYLKSREARGREKLETVTSE